MKQVFPLGKFYGATRRQAEVPAFAFAEVEDCNNIEVPLHTHENAHFLFVISGGYEALVSGRRRSFSSSGMVYYPAGTTHRDHFYTPGERRFLTVSLTPEASERLPREINLVDRSVDFNCAEISWLGGRIRRELRSPDSLSAIALEALANELLVFAARSLENTDRPPAWLKRALELIKDGCAESVTIAEIAAAVGVHPLHLARTFRRFFGCSPGEYLRRCRIELASDLMLNSTRPLAEIALLCGYADQSQFTQSFRRSTGTTPDRFRRARAS